MHKSIGGGILYFVKVLCLTIPKLFVEGIFCSLGELV